MKAIRTLLACIRKADEKYNLINHGDKIVLGLSGGKDSMALLYCLSLYKKFSHTEFEIQPVTLDLGFDGFNRTYLDEFCESLGLKLIVWDAKEVYPILKANQKEEHHLPCSICSKMKKAAINKAANELGYNKVAFAHHADDAVETLFMNEFYGGRIATFAPKMHLDRANITFIRPFILVRENDIKRFVKEENMFIPKSACPADKFTTREDVKNLLLDIYKTYPQSKENLLTMLDNYSKFDIWDKEIFMQIDQKGLTLKPVVNKEDTLNYINTKNNIFLNKDNINNGIFNIEDELNSSQYLIYLKDEIVGTVSYKILNNSIKIDNLGVYSMYRAKGIGSSVLKFFSDYLWSIHNPKPIYVMIKKEYIPFFKDNHYEIETDNDNEIKMVYIK